MNRVASIVSARGSDPFMSRRFYCPREQGRSSKEGESPTAAFSGSGDREGDGGGGRGGGGDGGDDGGCGNASVAVIAHSIIRQSYRCHCRYYRYVENQWSCLIGSCLPCTCPPVFLQLTMEICDEQHGPLSPNGVPKEDEILDPVELSRGIGNAVVKYHPC
uniref:Uncharacterized protein n=1 Tax=Echinococcus granulosus TaxID=6210 RepID=A0A068WZ22_ECHGR|nr:hypothetical protein EgrG_002033900 [Echinococcus granulosus]